MRRILAIVAALVGLGLVGSQAAEPSKSRAKNPDITQFAMEAMNAQSLNVMSLREKVCGGNSFADTDANNAAFAGCVMYVLGAVDMLREWQAAAGAHAPSLCLPRAISAGDLILAVQEHIEATAPWRQEQFDASRAVIAALAAKWPCQSHQ